MDFLQLATVLLLLAVLIISTIWLARPKTNGFEKAPQPAGALPLLGHLHLLRQKPLSEAFGSMADDLGPVFSLRLGYRVAFVVNNWEAVKECFTTNDVAISARPNLAMSEHLGYNSAMFGFAPYGDYWRSLQKFVKMEMLSNARLESLKHKISAEINVCMQELYEQCVQNNGSPVKVGLKEWFGDMISNIVISMIAGKRYYGSGDSSGEARRFKEGTGRYFQLLHAFVVSDWFPYLKWVDFGGRKKAMKAVTKEMDSMISDLLEDHRRRRKSGEREGDRDFMDVMLSFVDTVDYSRFDRDTVIKATSLALIVGSIESTTFTATWIINQLLNNRGALKKLQAELDAQVGRSRLVDDSDAKKLVYLQAVIKESLRLSPPSDLLPPRQAMHDFTVSGFRVPAGSLVFINNWKLHRDARVWAEPLEFRPERFLAGHSEARGHNFQFVPFGCGRRSCPGDELAMRFMQLGLARLLQAFDVDESKKSSNGEFGKLGSEYSALQVMLTPRLPASLYGL